uniref:Neuronal acetylcholine receptor subunit alpha-5-like isoform X1 n=1 Tax=Crassostrea virginica TaxID=6565 RepID=A0A8B8CEA0_CRAVI|nr:neuronal acetylcholine receptor subunit alpha-5-like isoform X1 [Crassostrea virginica]XP_022312929.1 neuronal acetylcholine receptor subunit alpha-5-like isoform X1 [Crassostrea virginica]XP_022312930.1 neuronal acetylcholine receptor subunit alpha-5-like isoform X1 [Crassostrea virginica]XP_022312931.1 neuronal acetylcholine receptor subunit alpha-5-like isoform X1 [Crassostrea virginica]
MDVKWELKILQTFLCWSFLMTIFKCRGTGYSSNTEFSYEDRVIKHLLRKYAERGKYGRPVKNYSDILNLHFGLQLVQIMNLDERKQILTLNVWTNYGWTDVHLRWNVTEFHGVKKINIPAHEIWTPDLRLYNFADERLHERRDSLCIVGHDGSVSWIPQAIFKSSCDIDVKAFPFDKQKCHLKFGSWTYDGLQLDLFFKDNKEEMDTSEFQISNVWHVISAVGKKSKVTYTCCPEPFIDLTFWITIRRKATFYAYTLILPCVLLTSLTLILFWIPAESPAKLTLGMSTFMAFFILLIIFEANLPPAATSFPVIGTYYCVNMVLITMSSFLCVFVVNMSVSGTRYPVHLPKTLKKVMFSYVARALCMDNVVKPFMDEGHVTCPTTSRRYMGVNGDGSKFTNDWKGSSETLITVQKESNTELAVIHTKVNEIRNFIKIYKERLEDKDRKEKIAKEWKVLALIFDRIFFIIYITTIIVSLMVVLPIIFDSDIED